MERTGRRGKRIKNIIDTFVNDEGALVVILIGAIFLFFFCLFSRIRSGNQKILLLEKNDDRKRRKRRAGKEMENRKRSSEWSNPRKIKFILQDLLQKRKSQPFIIDFFLLTASGKLSVIKENQRHFGWPIQEP